MEPKRFECPEEMVKEAERLEAIARKLAVISNAMFGRELEFYLAARAIRLQAMEWEESLKNNSQEDQEP
jgi:hypothetical protein